MNFKKAFGKIFAVELTKSEQKALDAEILKQLAEDVKRHNTEVDAIILWQLHEQLGFGYDRLRRFYDGFAPELKVLTERYEMGDIDQAWLCTHKLKEIGVDLDEWYKDKK